MEKKGIHPSGPILPAFQPGSPCAIKALMPIYEYSCKKCGSVIEKIQKFSDPPLQKHENCGGKLTKLISQSSFHLKGSGWYVTDYARKDSKVDGDGESAKEGSSKSDSDREDTKKTSGDKSDASASSTKETSSKETKKTRSSDGAKK